MKNEKMKRVAALALAGTMMASTLSTTALAADEEKLSTLNADDVQTQAEETKTEPDTTIESATETDKTTDEETGETETEFDINQSVTETPDGEVVESDGDATLVETPVEDSNQTEVDLDGNVHDEVVVENPTENEDLTEEEQMEAEKVESAVDSELAGAIQEEDNQHASEVIKDKLDGQEIADGSLTVEVGEVESTEGTDQAEDTTPENDPAITEETTYTETTTITLTPTEDAEGNPAPLTKEELEKFFGELTENEDGSYTTADGSTIEVTADNSTATTETSWVVKVTQQISKGEGEAAVEDKVEVGDLTQEGNTTITDGEGNPAEGTLVENPAPALTADDVEAVLKGEGGESWTDNGDGTYTKTDGSVTYTIKTETIEGITTDDMSADEIAGLLGDNYKAEDDKIFYTDSEGNSHEVQLVDGEAGQKLLVTVTQKDEKGAESEIKAEIDTDGDGEKETVTGEDAIAAEDEKLQNEAQAEAEKAAAEAVLKGVLGVEEIPEGVELVKDPSTGEWTAKYTEEGTEKTYTFKVESEAESDLEDKIDGVTADEDQDVTVTGDAYVESGTIEWSGEYEGFGEGDESEYNAILKGQIGEDGKLHLDDEAPLPEPGQTATYDEENAPTFNGEKVLSVTVDDQGRITSMVTVKEGSSENEKQENTYTFAYDQEVEDWQEEGIESALEDQIRGDAAEDGTISGVDVDANLTKFTWNVSTVTEKTEEVEISQEEKAEVTGDLKEDQDGGIYVEFGDEKVDLVEGEDGKLEAEGNPAGVTVEETETAKSDEEVEKQIQDLLAGKENTDIKIEKDETTGKFTATYTGKDGNTYTATYDAKDVTVTKTEEDKLEVKDDTVADQLKNAYDEGYKIQEYEDFLKDSGLEYNADDLHIEEFYKYLQNNNAGSVETETKVELKTEEELDSSLSQLDQEGFFGNSAIKKDYEDRFTLYAELTTNGVGNGDPNYLITSVNANKVSYGTTGALSGLDDSNLHQFDLDDEIITENGNKENHLKYDQADENGNIHGGEDGSFYHVSGTMAVNLQGTFDNEEAAKAAYPNGVVVACPVVDKDGTNASVEYRVYEKEVALEAFGKLNAESETGQGENSVYNLRLDLDKLVETDDGYFTKDTYKETTSWTASLTKVQQKEGSVLTVDSLLKTEKTESKSDGNRISGNYQVTEYIRVSNESCGTPSQADKTNAIYRGESEETYQLSKDWLTTETTYTAEAEQYGMGAKLDFTYTDYGTPEVIATEKVMTEDRVIDLEATVTPAPTENPDGPGEGGGETPETPETPEQPEGPTLILTDVPVEEEIVEEETPLAAAPAEEEAVIEDEDTPLAADPETDAAEIEDEDTPLSAVPKTGDESGIFLLMSMISGMALAALSFIDRKGRHSRFGSQH